MQAGFPRDKGTDSNNEVSVVKASVRKAGFDWRYLVFNSKIQLVVYYQRCVLISLATIRTYVVAH